LDFSLWINSSVLLLIYKLCQIWVSVIIRVLKIPTWSSTCFGRHTAHHQEPKTALAASGFAYVEGCWTCSWWTLSGTVCLTKSTNYTSKQRCCVLLDLFLWIVLWCTDPLTSRSLPLFYFKEHTLYSAVQTISVSLTASFNCTIYFNRTDG